jgi:hypothetical protein
MMVCCIQTKKGDVDEFKAESDKNKTLTKVDYSIAGDIRSA